MANEKKPEDPVKREIDDQIRALYQGTVEEGVPDKFAKLLEELRKKESN
ncbi:MAG: NepR family anti-sigma factor [Mangrovicoccus sp.]